MCRDEKFTATIQARLVWVQPCVAWRTWYSAYFWHLIVIALSEEYFPHLSPPERATHVIPISLTLTTLTYLTIERPIMHLGARLACMLGQASSPSPSLIFSSE
jgi:peptidoglycan/LPS O-acetylase OafA/YrhL